MLVLGKYATTVLLAYGVSLTLVLALVALSLWQYRRAARVLDEAENA